MNITVDKEKVRVADIEQIHSFWVTIWTYLMLFKRVLSSEETHKAIISIHQPIKHRFWSKFKEALWTLVVVPEGIESARFQSCGTLPVVSTRDWLNLTRIEISPNLKMQFAPEQPEDSCETYHVRLIYDADDIYVLGNITSTFPCMASTPFEKDFPQKYGSTGIFTLTRIEQFTIEAERGDPTNGAICDSGSENVFMVDSQDGPIMISVRKKLNTWRMRQVKAGDALHSSNVYVFV